MNVSLARMDRGGGGVQETPSPVWDLRLGPAPERILASVPVCACAGGFSLPTAEGSPTCPKFPCLCPLVTGKFQACVAQTAALSSSPEAGLRSEGSQAHFSGLGTLTSTPPPPPAFPPLSETSQPRLAVIPLSPELKPLHWTWKIYGMCL